MHEGHRQRMIERLAKADALQDHELLEILLFNAVPRRNTNPIAHELLDTFFTLDGVLHAGAEELTAVRGVGRETAAYLRCIGVVFDRARSRGQEEKPRPFNVQNFSAFVSERIGALPCEVVELYCIDGNERVHTGMRFSAGSVNKAAVEPEEIGRFLAMHRPTGLVAAHNHPNTPAVPSEADDRFTVQLQILCSIHNVRLYDHIIIGEGSPYSYFLAGRMEEIRRDFHIDRLLGGKLCL